MRKRLLGWSVWLLILAAVLAVATLAYRSGGDRHPAAGRDDPRGWIDEAPAAHAGHPYDDCAACRRERLMREAASTRPTSRSGTAPTPARPSEP